MARYCGRVHNTCIFWVLVVLIGICLVAGAQAQRANLQVQSNDGVTTKTDLLASGYYPLQHTYSISAYNMDDDSDTVLGNITYSLGLLDMSHVVTIDRKDYATVNGSAVQWVFPGDVTIPENNHIIVGVKTDYYDLQYVPVTLQRQLNSTRFTSDGYQMARFNITFEDLSRATGDLPCTSIWVGLTAGRSGTVNASFVPGTFTTDLPLSRPIDSGEIHYLSFAPDLSQLEENRVYMIETVVKIDLPGDEVQPVEYRPYLGVGLGNSRGYVDTGTAYTTAMPEDLLPPGVTHAAVSTNVSNRWSYSVNYMKMISLSQISRTDREEEAEFEIQLQKITRTDADLLESGYYPLQHRYLIRVSNDDDSSDTILGNVTYTLGLQDMSCIVEIEDSDYATVDQSAVRWVFPEEIVIHEDRYLGSKVKTDKYETQYVPLTLRREMNNTNFYSDGYQQANFSITFEDISHATEDLPCTSILIGLTASQADIVNASFVPESVITDLPLRRLSSSDIHHLSFYPKMEQIEENQTYTIKTVVKIDLPDEDALPVEYKPYIVIYLRNENDSEGAVKAHMTTMPEDMLPPGVIYASASTNVSNRWSYELMYKKEAALSEIRRYAQDIPTAHFTANTTTGPAPLTVQFTDTGTIENAAAWRWDFGNGFLSKVRNPLFTYHGAGAYNVSLTVTDAENRTWKTVQENYITVT
ncbi:PKD domain-containing protein [Methanofollis tationis]|nr:PKD domain-containing protein [Methanofollis tationis]